MNEEKLNASVGQVVEEIGDMGDPVGAARLCSSRSRPEARA